MYSCYFSCNQKHSISLCYSKTSILESTLLQTEIFYYINHLNFGKLLAVFPQKYTVGEANPDSLSTMHSTHIIYSKQQCKKMTSRRF